MTFEQWVLINKFPSENCALVATKAAWDYQQKKIDELRDEIERMYKDRGLYSGWSDSNDN